MQTKQNKGCLIICKGDINKTKQNKGCLIICKGEM